MLDNPYQYTDYKSDSTREARGTIFGEPGLEEDASSGGTRQRTGLRRGAGARARRARVLRRRPPADDPGRGRGRGRPGPADRPPAAAHPEELGYVRVGRRRLRADPAGARASAWRTSASQGLWDDRPPAPGGPRRAAPASRRRWPSSTAPTSSTSPGSRCRRSSRCASRSAPASRPPRPRRARCCSPPCRPTSWRRRSPQPSQSGLPPYIGRTGEQLLDELAQVRARGLGPGRRGARPRRPLGGGARPRRHRRRARGDERHRPRRRDQRRHAARRPPAAPAPRRRRGQRRVGAVAEPPARGEGDTRSWSTPVSGRPG